MNTIILKITAIFTALALYLGLGFSLQMNEIENVPTKLDDDIRVMSINLLSVENDDPEKSLTTRAKLFIDMINEYQPDSFGVQECNFEWLWILKANLGDDYACVSQSRTGSLNDETNAIFYLRDKYKAIDSDTFWLSETPNSVGSTSFNTVDPRICTWVTLENKDTGEVYTHVNTHLDFAYSSTREAQAQVILDELSELFSAENQIVFTGDLNSTENSKVYSMYTEILSDTKTLAVNTDSGQTYHGMDNPDYVGNDTLVYDYVFVSQGSEVETYKIIDEKIDGLNYSDHYGICVDFNF